MLRIYNSLSKEKEIFEPLETGKVKMYVCGPTVYDSCHIGHARSVVVFDVIARYLRAVGYEVTYVRNFTDVDDKIINRANALGVSTKELSEKYIQEFYEVMDALKVERATIEPKATDHIPQIVDVIRHLMEKGLAYASGGDVFFSVERFPDYGRLSGRRLEDMQAGARVEVDEKKHNPFDFVLWKGAKPGEPMWDSPWGKGRPGWHIECTAMSTHYLGKHIDIHGGGKDLSFPHHENEIAQSEGAFGKGFVKLWVHNGFVQINQEKMSKSLGNFLTVRDILQQYHPEVIRLFLLSNHYRSPVDFTDQAMKEAEGALEKIYGLLDRISSASGKTRDGATESPGEFWRLFCESMDDDFNTAKAVGQIFDAVRKFNRLMDETPDRGSAGHESDIRSFCADFFRVGQVLGIGTDTPGSFFGKKKAKALENEAIDEAMVERLIEARKQARKEKDWAKADQLRDQLAAMNVVLEDRPEGTIWQVKA
jgi:cysteinyl-tRNA synthetase